MSTLPPASRVVITGIGLISPSGCTPDELWDALSSGRSAIGPSTLVPEQAGPMKIAAEAKGFTGAIGDFGDLDGKLKKSIRKAIKMMCRETQMAVAAAQLSLADAGLGESDCDPERTGVVLGSDYMLTMPEDYVRAVEKCAEDHRFNYGRWGDEGLAEIEPLWMLRYLPNMPASHIAIFNDLRGPNNSLTMREAAGLMAVGEAYRIISRGVASRMVAGATGTRLMPMQAIHSMQLEQLAPADGDPAKACRPFDKSRQGMVAGEGAATIVLESLEAAEARGAKIYAEVTGFGASQVADTQLSGDTQAALTNSMRAALKDADLQAGGVGHVSANALGTTDGDAAEARAISTVFGADAARVPVTALKSYFGNLGAAGGVVELVGGVLALRSGTLPRVLNYQTPDPECPVQAVREDGQPAGASVLANSVTPQGQAATVVAVAAD
ncbi:3-oxoacyl-[acyl-carrier-protein] synthase 2 [Posidoniimonas corsicana]|uniref:3-oxoacyl-[acyl-carrier-protein] synthase 2 n=1 Tax=Posidoniimonas corsicana TaxID=1938618 RepID=A0A5C5VDD9_9BACT|nr:beta-ketoacyl-[acyl-carrier-protein] synthase family protein [Posidoniimonas corsicana]TWT36023.1 3-oxoacyl-[acyl-carrier-protein] synthase 2 [Posidoniimonas corsicana]